MIYAGVPILARDVQGNHGITFFRHAICYSLLVDFPWLRTQVLWVQGPFTVITVLRMHEKTLLTLFTLKHNTRRAALRIFKLLSELAPSPASCPLQILFLLIIESNQLCISFGKAAKPLTSKGSSCLWHGNPKVSIAHSSPLHVQASALRNLAFPGTTNTVKFPARKPILYALMRIYQDSWRRLYP